MHPEPLVGEADRAELPWRRFPLGRQRILANRWIDRRRAVVFVAWYALILIPALLLISRTPQVSSLLGFPMLAAAVLAGLYCTLQAMGKVGSLRVDLNQDTAIDGHEVLSRYGPKTQQAPQRYDLHSGSTGLRQPAWWTWWSGRAPVLTARNGRRAVAVLLLGDPRTGELRPSQELRELSDALAASPHETDRATGRAVLDLATRAALAGMRSESASGWEPEEIPHSIWSALKSVGRGLAQLAVIATISFFGGLTHMDHESLNGGAAANWSVNVLILGGIALLTIWVFVFAYRLYVLVRTVVRASVRLMH